MLSPAWEYYPIGTSVSTTHTSPSCHQATPQQWSAFGTMMLSALETPSNFSQQLHRRLSMTEEIPSSGITSSNKSPAVEAYQDDARSSGDDE